MAVAGRRDVQKAKLPRLVFSLLFFLFFHVCVCVCVCDVEVVKISCSMNKTSEGTIRFRKCTYL